MINQSRLELCQGDITREETEAIVNAANSNLRGGGGVDGAIHKAAGSQLMAELRQKYNFCPTGSAVITKGWNLKANYVIHTVGPIYHGTDEDGHLLSSAYNSSLKLCTEHHIKYVSFPSISTGAYGYPIQEASLIALRTITNYLYEHNNLELIRMVLFSKNDYEIYKQTLEQLRK